MPRSLLAPAPTAVLLVSLLWLAGLGLAPLVRADPAAWPTPVRAAAGFAYLAGARVCHQRPERSFQIGATPLPVCARCTGVYFGAVLGLSIVVAAAGFAARTIERAPYWLAVAALPTVASVGTEWVGLGSPMWSRAAAAVPLGAAVALVVGVWVRHATIRPATLRVPGGPGPSATLP